MLDTSNIPKDELEQKMYEESMNTYNIALKDALRNVESTFNTIDSLKSDMMESINSDNHGHAYIECSNLVHYLNSASDYVAKLRNVLFIKPKKPNNDILQNPR